MPHHGKADALRAAIRRLKDENKRLRRAVQSHGLATRHALFCDECTAPHTFLPKLLCPTGLTLHRKALALNHDARLARTRPKGKP